MEQQKVEIMSCLESGKVQNMRNRKLEVKIREGVGISLFAYEITELTEFTVGSN